MVTLLLLINAINKYCLRIPTHLKFSFLARIANVESQAEIKKADDESVVKPEELANESINELEDVGEESVAEPGELAINSTHELEKNEKGAEELDTPGETETNTESSPKYLNGEPKTSISLLKLIFLAIIA